MTIRTDIRIRSETRPVSQPVQEPEHLTSSRTVSRLARLLAFSAATLFVASGVCRGGPGHRRSKQSTHRVTPLVAGAQLAQPYFAGVLLAKLVSSFYSQQNTVESDVPRDSAKSRHWHQWRGPAADGVSRTAKPPLRWSEDRNIKWKVDIGGRGNASPIVWGEKVFLVTATNTGRVDPTVPAPEDQPKRVFGIKYPNTDFRFEVLCLDRQTGVELWRQTAREHVPHEGTHSDADFASASPTTDGSRLFCWFGSAGMHCYDLDGKKLWERQLGKAYVGASLGEGCSPVVHDDRVVIVRDHARQSTIEVLDAKSGDTLWKQDRDEPNAWATPCVVEHSGKT